MTRYTEINPGVFEHGMGMEEPKHTFRGWSILDGRNAALGLQQMLRPNVMAQLGYYEEMADLAFVVERMKNA